jgi:protein N-terminal methyltransferase
VGQGEHVWYRSLRYLWLTEFDSIGRISKNFLTKINNSVVVDIIEPVKKFTAEIEDGENWKEEREARKIGQIFNVGLETWAPEKKKYWLIWK